MIKVLVNGAYGRMGKQVVEAVQKADDMELVAQVDINASSPDFSDLHEALIQRKPDVVVDFTHPSSVENNVKAVLEAQVACVVGTTGLSSEQLNALVQNAPGEPHLFVAPNFTTGAVLMMEFAKLAAKYFPDAEVIELHHDGKADAPSGTAIKTAQAIAANRTDPSCAPGSETELPQYQGARGASVDGVPVHSVRTQGHVASQEVIFGSIGQTLTIRHDSHDRSCYMPGVLMAIRAIQDMPGLTVGLDNLMF